MRAIMCEFISNTLKKNHMEPSIQAMQFFNLNCLYSVGLVKNSDTTI